jgi:diguanylate cyclase
VNHPPNRPERRVPRRVERRTGTVTSLDAYRGGPLDKLASLGRLSATSFPDPLELLRSVARVTDAATAEVVLFDGRSSRWSTDPSQKLSRNPDANPDITELVLTSNGEQIGALYLLAHPDCAIDESLAALAGQFMAMALGTTRLSTELAAELETHEHEATHDQLTGMANRVAFEQAVDAALTDVSASLVTTKPHGAAIIVLDLNRFKEINASFGHAVGDVVVAAVASRLVGSLEPFCAAARIGGDSFAVLLPNVTDLVDAETQAHRLLRAVSGPIDANSEATIHVDAAMGCAVAPFHGATRGLLMQRADVAMYIAKESPESSLRMWDESQEHVTHDQLELVVDLREAIEHGELDVYYQPKTNISSGHVVGAEALVRWSHPQRGAVSPDEMVPLAEHTGLIHDLTWFVLHTALAQCSQWHRDGMKLHVAVNLPARSLRDADLPDDIENALASAGLDGQWLTLEITESEFSNDSELSRSVVERIRNLGVRLAIDDFGTGYSALAYLARLDVDELKIDKSFVMDLGDNPANVAIVRAVIEVASSFGLETVAEGVEDTRALQRLLELGCTTAQGYLLSRPLPAEEMGVWLRAHTAAFSASLDV